MRLTKWQALFQLYASIYWILVWPSKDTLIPRCVRPQPALPFREMVYSVVFGAPDSGLTYLAFDLCSVTCYSVTVDCASVFLIWTGKILFIGHSSSTEPCALYLCPHLRFQTPSYNHPIYLVIVLGFFRETEPVRYIFYLFICYILDCIYYV